MNLVVEETCASLEQISQSVRNGVTTRQQAEYASMQRLQFAMMTFQLLQTFYEGAAEERTKATQPAASPALPTPSTFQDDGLAVTVPAPASSADMSQDAVQYLELTPPQIAAIQAAAEDNRAQTGPLLEKLADGRRRLTAATLNGHFDEKEVRLLAAEQAKVLEQLIIANTELETRLYQTLTTEQRHKMDELRKALDNILQPSTTP